ncbi:hypothetical protein N0V86_004734 [Didymella sp. IMI 355093]|nr:hypothetical protein N0V86_004734 [Didymella sp. IMI 355093]
MASKVLPLVPWRKTELPTASKSEQSAQAVHAQALDLFVLGFPEQANTLLKALYDHGHGLEFDIDIDAHPKSYYLSWEFVGYLMCLYAAWEVFDCLPSWIEHPDPEKPFRGRDDLVRTEPLWDEYKDRWVEGFPSNLREKVLEEGQIEKSELQDLLQQLENQTSRVVAKTRISIGAVVQAATLAGDDQTAKSLVENDVANLYRHFQDPSNQPDVYSYDLRVRLSQRLGLHYGPKIWGYLRDARIGTALEIDASAVDEFVEEGCELIKQRFTEGPTRPYSDRTIADLVDLLDEAHNTQASLNGEDQPQTRRKPATEKEITDLEYNLCSAVQSGATCLLDGEALPEDYKEFLRITNGFWSDRYHDQPNNPGNLFYGIQGIDTSDDCLWVHDLDFTLLPWEVTHTFQDEIALGDFTGFSVGAGGDEGSAILIPPSSMKDILERFDEVYAAADTRGKKVLERGALDLYGGIERLRKMEWLCVESFHWDPEPRLYYGFRGYLEYCVEKAVRETDELHESESEEEEDGEVEGEEDDESDAAKGTKRKRDHEVDEA